MIKVETVQNNLPSPVIQVLPTDIVSQIRDALIAIPSDVNESTAQAADKASAELHRIEKLIEARRTEMKKPVTALSKAIEEVCKSASAPVEDARRKLNGKIGQFLRSQEEARQATIRAAQEAERLRQEAETNRIEAERKAREEAAKPVEQVDELFIGFVEPAPVPVPPPAQAKVVIPAPIVIPPKQASASVSLKTIKVLKITDPDAIPRIYLDRNDARVKKALLDGIAVPGAELVEEQVAAQKGY